jgi:hypothetical protein
MTRKLLCVMAFAVLATLVGPGVTWWAQANDPGGNPELTWITSGDAVVTDPNLKTYEACCPSGKCVEVKCYNHTYDDGKIFLSFRVRTRSDYGMCNGSVLQDQCVRYKTTRCAKVYMFEAVCPHDENETSIYEYDIYVRNACSNPLGSTDVSCTIGDEGGDN